MSMTPTSSSTSKRPNAGGGWGVGGEDMQRSERKSEYKFTQHTEARLTLHSDSGLCGGGSSVIDSAAHVSARIVVVGAVDLQDAQVVFSPHLVVLV